MAELSDEDLATLLEELKEERNGLSTERKKEENKLFKETKRRTKIPRSEEELDLDRRIRATNAIIRRRSEGISK